MKSCNVVSLTKVKSIDSQNVEYDKVLDAILSNYQFISFDAGLDDIEKSKIYEVITNFTHDIVELHNNLVPDLTIDMSYNVHNSEFEIMVNFLQTGQSLDSKLFDLAIEYADKYEDIIIGSELVGLIFFDFNTMTKNENLHIITKYSDGTVMK